MTHIRDIGDAWTPEDRRRIVELALQGLDNREIAIAVGRSAGAVATRLSRDRITRCENSPAVRERILELAEEGATPGRIARRVGLTEDAVLVVLRRAGIQPRAIVSYRGPDRRRASV